MGWVFSAVSAPRRSTSLGGFNRRDAEAAEEVEQEIESWVEHARLAA